MKKIFCCILSFILIEGLHAQKTDTLSSDTSSKIPVTWKKFHPGIRIVTGAQKAFFLDAGLGWQRYIYAERHGYYVYGFFTAFQWVPKSTNDKAVYGVKAGYEVVNNGTSGGIDVAYQWNGDSTDVVFTPRMGLGIGFVNINYGYNLSTNKRPFKNIGRHQLSLVINTNLIFYHLGEKRR